MLHREVAESRITRFRRLHESGCFVMPNPWDPGSAKLLELLGFPAVATTSAGFAWSIGRPDTHVTLEQALTHFRVMSAAVGVPVNADFEGAFAVDAETAGRNIALAAQTGIAGVSIEDSSKDDANPLFDFALSVERVRAAREAIDAGGTGVVLTARSEGFIANRPDLDETIRRLKAYADAGADCLYAPGIRDHAQIKAIVDAVAPKPVNALVYAYFATVDEMRAIGVRRISVGGALARAAWSGALEAAREIAENGTFTALGRAVSGLEVNGWFR